MEREKLKEYLMGTFAAHSYTCIGFSLLWLNNIWKNHFTDYISAFSIVFIILSFIIAMKEHQEIKEANK